MTFRGTPYYTIKPVIIKYGVPLNAKPGSCISSTALLIFFAAAAGARSISADFYRIDVYHLCSTPGRGRFYAPLIDF
jgi:hypothetical protein